MVLRSSSTDLYLHDLIHIIEIHCTALRDGGDVPAEHRQGRARHPRPVLLSLRLPRQLLCLAARQVNPNTNCSPMLTPCRPSQTSLAALHRPESCLSLRRLHSRPGTSSSLARSVSQSDLSRPATSRPASSLSRAHSSQDTPTSSAEILTTETPHTPSHTKPISQT